MKKSFKIVVFTTVVLIGCCVGYAKKQSKIMSSLMLANIEALTRGEDGVAVGICYLTGNSGLSGYQIFL